MANQFRSFAIIPAAGESRRMGQPKLLLQRNGRTVIETVLAAWQASGVERIVVVVRPGDAALAELVQSERIDLVVPDHAPPDMRASVLAGLQHVQQRYSPALHDAWLLAPADLPWLSSAAIDAVLASYEASEPTIVTPTYRGKRGHPVLFPWSLVAEARKLKADQGLNALLQTQACREARCDFATYSATADLDSPDDYQRWIADQS